MNDKNQQYRKDNSSQNKTDSKGSDNSKKGFFSWSSKKQFLNYNGVVNLSKLQDINKRKFLFLVFYLLLFFVIFAELKYIIENVQYINKN